MVSLDECSFVSCVSLYTRCYQRPKGVSPLNPQTHHIHPPIHPTWHLIIFFLLSSGVLFIKVKTTLRFRLHSPREAICVALKHIKRCETLMFGRVLQFSLIWTDRKHKLQTQKYLRCESARAFFVTMTMNDECASDGAKCCYHH